MRGRLVELAVDAVVVVVGNRTASKMAHKSNPYKKSRAKFRWKWKKKRTRRLQRKRRQMRQRSK